MDSIHPDIHRLSAYLLVDRRAWGSAERQGLKHSKTLEKFKDIKIQAGAYLDIKTKKIKKTKKKKDTARRSYEFKRI